MEQNDPRTGPAPTTGGGGLDKFTSFIRPFLRLIDTGALFRLPFMWLYVVFAVLNIIGMVVSIIGMFQGGGAVGFFMGLVGLLAFWAGFQVWWDRRTKVAHMVARDADFVALPVFSHLIQTAGEWAGAMITVAGVLSSLVLAFSGGRGGTGMLPLSDMMPFLGGAPLMGLIMAPIMGFVVIVVSRALAEQIRALVAIANNTHRTAENTRR
ncbi:MAG: hypothetical protein RBT71_02735 [Flavobacteriales bacterium]|jgi:hypothetical protein|nr:hypothetical protein [Flavobacteriales bacterium]